MVFVVQPTNNIIIIRTQPNGGKDLIITCMVIYYLEFKVAEDVSLASL
jgi:hypothetical protein